MAWLDQITVLNGQQINPNQAYSSIYPLWEQQTPQYQAPNPYPLAVNGFRRNEVIYACANKRAKAIAEPPIRVTRIQNGADEELPDHKLRQLIKTPIRLADGTVKLTEKSFWRATQIYLCVAGFAAWEMELNNRGEPINLYPMRPDWCAFRRGQGNPLEYIRYQPYGLPYADIPANRVLLFQYFDPIFPLLKALSPSAVSNRVTTVDNGTTDFLQLFFQRGAIINGLLKTDQSLQQAEALRIQALWEEQHGGVSNWGKPAVLGSGVSYQAMQMNFREMQFSEIDGRDESRICMAFEMPPILVNAKVGIQASTYSNYEQARKAWYEEWVSPEWDWLDSELEAQLLPRFESDITIYAVGFDTSKVRAMQEDEDAKHTRAREDAKIGIIDRDEARKMIGLDPIDENEDVWLNVTIRAQEQGNPDIAAQTDMSIEQPKETMPTAPETETPAQVLERKQFRAFAAKRIKEGHPERVKEFQFKYSDVATRSALLAEHGGTNGHKHIPAPLAAQIQDALKEFHAAMKA